jgi:hypothetical protein
MSEVAKEKMRDLFKGYPHIFTSTHDRQDWVLLYATNAITVDTLGKKSLTYEHFVCAFSPGSRRAIILATNSLLTVVRSHHLFGFHHEDYVKMSPGNRYSFRSPHAGDEVTITLTPARTPIAVFVDSLRGLSQVFSFNKQVVNKIQIDQKAELKEFKTFLKTHFTQPKVTN